MWHNLSLSRCATPCCAWSASGRWAARAIPCGVCNTRQCSKSAAQRAAAAVLRPGKWPLWPPRLVSHPWHRYWCYADCRPHRKPLWPPWAHSTKPCRWLSVAPLCLLYSNCDRTARRPAWSADAAHPFANPVPLRPVSRNDRRSSACHWLHSRSDCRTPRTTSGRLYPRESKFYVVGSVHWKQHIIELTCASMLDTTRKLTANVLVSAP